MDSPDRIGAPWDEAFAARRPVLAAFVADPNVPPLPPHITLEQARAYASSLVKVDPNRWGIIRNSVKQLFSR